jgi:hypothetical protein
MNKQFDVSTSPIACGSFPNVLKVFKHQQVDAVYRRRKIEALLLSLITEPFRWWEEIRYGKAIAQAQLPAHPLFILGHWRSGTTFLHNLICQDEQFAFVTTYQSVFPNQLHGSKWLFKNIMNVFLPEKRPADNMELDPDFPQEEEIAIGNMIPYSFYNFLYFPRNTFDFYEKYVRFNNVSDDVIQKWIATYCKLIRSSLLYHGKKQFISKNPPNTARIKILLKYFPQAKFIYIYRNPVNVFLSASRFFKETIPSITFHYISQEELHEIIFELYIRLIQDYENSKHQIPKGNLIEIRYEDFEKDPVDWLNKIYHILGIKGFENALPRFESYLNSQSKFEKHRYKVSRDIVDTIMKRWGFSMQLYGYDVPEEMVLV